MSNLEGSDVQEINHQLMLMMEMNCVNGVKQCLENGADPNARYGVHQLSALHLTAAQGMTDMVVILLTYKAEVEYIPFTSQVLMSMLMLLLKSIQSTRLKLIVILQ